MLLICGLARGAFAGPGLSRASSLPLAVSLRRSRVNQSHFIGMIYCRLHRLPGAPPDGRTSSPPRIATERAGVGQILRAAVLIGSTSGQRGPGRGQRRRREGTRRPRARALDEPSERFLQGAAPECLSCRHTKRVISIPAAANETAARGGPQLTRANHPDRPAVGHSVRADAGKDE